MTSNRLFVFACITALCALPLVACGGSTSPLVEDVDRMTLATEEGDFNALVAEGERHWAERSSLESTEAAIAAWERAARVPTPDNMSRRAALYPVYHQLSRAYYWLGDYQLQFADGVENRDARRKEAHARGMELGQLAIALNNDRWTQALLYEEPIREAARHLTETDLPAAYWYVVNTSRWALFEGTPEILRRTPDIRAMMERIRDLDEGYFYGATHRYFGAFHARLPLGSPDLDLSQRMFLTAIEMFPEYLDTRYLYVVDWTRPTNNREVAEEQLRAILDFDLDQAPEIRPENEASQHKARLMLEELDRYYR